MLRFHTGGIAQYLEWCWYCAMPALHTGADFVVAKCPGSTILMSTQYFLYYAVTIRGSYFFSCKSKNSKAVLITEKIFNAPAWLGRIIAIAITKINVLSFVSQYRKFAVVTNKNIYYNSNERCNELRKCCKYVPAKLF